MANPPGLIGDQPPATTDQGFLPGLLGKVRDFFPDPAAAYGGLLSDEATRRAFAWRELGAAAGAFSQGAMPVPYKGGIPFGATLGAAGAAASTAGDSLIQARLQQAQADLAQQQAAVAHGNVGLLQALPTMLKNYYGADGGQGSGAASGTGTDGKLTGPQKIIASQSGKQVSSTTADPSLPPEARALLDTISGPESGGAYNVRWGGPGGDKTFDDYSQHPNIPEPGPQGDSTAAGRYQIVNSTWKPLQAKYGFGDFTPATQDQAAWHLAADTYKQKTGGDLLGDLQAGKTDQVASALHGQWSTLRMGNYAANLDKYQGGGGASPQTAAVPPPPPGYKPQDASGGAYSVPPPPGPPPKPGEYAIPVRAGNVPPPPAAPPMAPSAAPAARLGGLLDLPDFSGQFAAPPSGAAPTARSPGVGVTGLLGAPPNMSESIMPVSAAGGGAPGAAPQEPLPQGVPMPGRLGGMGPVQGGLPPGLINVADTGGPSGGAAPNLVPGGAGANLPPQSPVTAGPPPPQSAAIRSLLEPLQPAPTATPYTNAPPVTGQGAAAPGPAAPVQTSQVPSAAAPASPQAAAIPGTAGIPSPQKIAQAQQIALTLSVLGKAIPPDIAETAKFPMAVALANATQQARVGPQIQIDTAQQALITQREVLLKQLQAGYDTVEVPVRDAQGNYSTVTMTRAQAGQYLGHVNAQLTGQPPPGGNGSVSGATAPGSTAGAPGGGTAPGVMPVGKPFFTPQQELDAKTAADIQVKTRENQLQMQRDWQQKQNDIAMLPLQKRQEALFTDYADNVQKPAGTADNARKTLAALSNSLANFQTGKTADERLGIAKLWADGVTTLGFTPSAAVQQMIASGETINKQGNTLGFEMAKELGSRESQMVVQAAIASNPGLAMSPQGNRQLIQLIDNGLQRDIAKKGFYDQYLTKNGTYEGADAAFRKANPVEATVSSVPGLEYHVKDEADLRRQNLPPGTRFIGPDNNIHMVGPNG